MEFGSLFCDELSEVKVVAYIQSVRAGPLTNPVVTDCDHCFCCPCMYKFRQGEAKPYPICSTMLSSDVNVSPAFDTHGALVLCLPVAEEVEPSYDDDMLDWSGIAAIRSLEQSSAMRDVDMAVVVFDQCMRKPNSKEIESVIEDSRIEEA